MSKIEIDSKPFATDYCYAGTYIKDIGDELEYREKLYDFVIHDADSEATSIIWEGDMPNPDEIDKIEEEIIKQYQER